MRTRLVWISITVTALGHPAQADDWFVAEAPAALAVSDAQEGLFRTGAMPAAGFYRDTAYAAIGLRLRGGVLRNGPAPSDHMRDPGTGGLVTASVALRFETHRWWFEAVGGVGMTGRDVAPAFEAGTGYNFSVGSLAIGPSVRLLRVENNDPTSTLGSAQLLLIGIEAQVGKTRKAEPPPPMMEPPPPVESPPPVAVQADHDTVADSDGSCLIDGTGCDQTLSAAVAAGTVEIVDDHIVLDDRVLFDVNVAEVRAEGRDVIAAIGKSWRAHPEWVRIVIEGHADVRGTDALNLELSQRRASLVRDALLALGFAADRVDAVGYGRTRLRDSGTTEQAHSRNRRVEFVIVRENPALVEGAL